MNKQSRHNTGLNEGFGERQIVTLVGTSAFCLMLTVIRIYMTGSGQYNFLMWNLFLAWLPYLVAWGMIRAIEVRAKPFLIAVAGAAWLLLFPNAPYITTDFIHLMVTRHGYTWNNVTGDQLKAWFDIVLFFLVSVCGYILGFISLYALHATVKRRWGTMYGLWFIASVSFLSGFGIYLGRFVRLNSWDILYHPSDLLSGIADSINATSFKFTIMYGLFQLFMYGLLYALTGIGRTEPIVKDRSHN